MKKSIFYLAITTVMAAAMLTGCQSSGTKVDNAQQNVQDAKDKVLAAQQELSQAIKDSILTFKTEIKNATKIGKGIWAFICLMLGAGGIKILQAVHLLK